MGYFSNGTEGAAYYDKWCAHCLHDNPDKEVHCPVWNAHLIHNYDQLGVLGDLIPRSEDGLHNERCRMFVDRGLLSNLAIEKFEYETT